jgi:16S rRNA (cytidine1402-2'-O)-methyltransferase
MPLYIVSTPIGNLQDLTFRAVQTLTDVDLIAAEDTRHSKKLLNHYEIKTPLTSYHSYSSTKKVEDLVQKMCSTKSSSTSSKTSTKDSSASDPEGFSIALISDAGTPGISDPAWTLITAARMAGVTIIPIPGPAAFLTALSASGLPMNQFQYFGFIPAKKGRQSLFKSVIEAKQTTIFYESPHRILKTLKQMEEILGPDRAIVMGRELTKMHEEFVRGTTGELYEKYKGKKVKGEIVLLLAPANFKW